MNYKYKYNKLIEYIDNYLKQMMLDMEMSYVDHEDIIDKQDTLLEVRRVAILLRDMEEN